MIDGMATRAVERAVQRLAAAAEGLADVTVEQTAAAVVLTSPGLARRRVTDADLRDLALAARP